MKTSSSFLYLLRRTVKEDDKGFTYQRLIGCVEGSSLGAGVTSAREEAAAAALRSL